MSEKIVRYKEPKNKLDRAVLYCKHFGLKAMVGRVRDKLTHKDEGRDEYQEFLKSHALTEEELMAQRSTEFAFSPKISIAVPLYNTPENFLEELLESVVNQTYGNWELVLADASPTEELKSFVEDFVEKLGLQDSGQIIYFHLAENKGIAANTNEAIDRCTGDFLALLDHDDVLTVDALFEMVKAINSDEEIDCLYSDEDTLIFDTGVCYNPHFKPDFSPNLLYHHNYITHLFVCRMSIVRRLGGERSQFDGAQDHDFILRATEVARKIHHIPKVLYHWRAHPASTAKDMNSKQYAFDAGRRAVQEHFARTGLDIEVDFDNHAGFYIPRFATDALPTVDKVRINDDVKGFKSTAELNEAVRSSEAEYILFKDADCVPVDGDSLDILLANMVLENVAVAGPKMFFGNNLVSHAGLVLGLNGLAGSPFYKIGREQSGYFFLSNTTHEVSAVSIDCMLVRRSDFLEAGGFDEAFTPHVAAVDLCLKLAGMGKSTIYNPYSQWYFLKDLDTSKVSASFEEEAAFDKKWESIIKSGDSYYNPNLTLLGKGYIL